MNNYVDMVPDLERAAADRINEGFRLDDRDADEADAKDRGDKEQDGDA